MGNKLERKDFVNFTFVRIYEETIQFINTTKSYKIKHKYVFEMGILFKQGI